MFARGGLKPTELPARVGNFGDVSRRSIGYESPVLIAITHIGDMNRRS
jgi:hypothetical protein